MQVLIVGTVAQEVVIVRIELHLKLFALVQAGKQFEMQFYPDDNHFLRNGANYEHLHKRILGFLDAAL